MHGRWVVADPMDMCKSSDFLHVLDMADKLAIRLNKFSLDLASRPGWAVPSSLRQDATSSLLDGPELTATSGPEGPRFEAEGAERVESSRPFAGRSEEGGAHCSTRTRRARWRPNKTATVSSVAESASSSEGPPAATTRDGLLI